MGRRPKFAPHRAKSCATRSAGRGTYQSRFHVHFEKQFYLDFPAATQLVVSSMCWVAIGYWFNVC